MKHLVMDFIILMTEVSRSTIDAPTTVWRAFLPIVMMLVSACPPHHVSRSIKNPLHLVRPPHLHPLKNHEPGILIDFCKDFYSTTHHISMRSLPSIHSTKSSLLTPLTLPASILQQINPDKSPANPPPLARTNINLTMANKRTTNANQKTPPEKIVQTPLTPYPPQGHHPSASTILVFHHSPTSIYKPPTKATPRTKSLSARSTTF